MARSLKRSEINHLRRLVAWVRCEYHLTPEEVVAAVNENRRVLGEPNEEAKRRLVEWYREKQLVPRYVHAAVKALQTTLLEIEGDIIDADVSAARALSHMWAKFQCWVMGHLRHRRVPTPEGDFLVCPRCGNEKPAPAKKVTQGV